MRVSIPSILLGLGGKSVLNWALLLLQRGHLRRTFAGVFGVSLALIDSALALFFATLYLHADGYTLLGSRLTVHHLCVLVQILGHIHSSLRWPVVAVVALEHCCIVLRPVRLGRAVVRWTLRMVVTCLLWLWACFHIFHVSDFTPILDDAPLHQVQQCWVATTSHVGTVLLLLIVGGAALSTWRRDRTNESQNHDPDKVWSRADVVDRSLRVFLASWGPFLAFLAALAPLPVGIPAYVMELNVPWLCFLSSFFIGVVLCAVCPPSLLQQGLAEIPPDSFCEWRFKLNRATEDKS